MAEERGMFDVDLYELHLAWVKHAKEYHEAAVDLAECRAEWEYSKTRRDVLLAELKLKIRRDPEAFGVVKLTESTVEETLTALPQYTKIQDKVTAAKYKTDIASALVDGLEHKKKALENLVQLEGRDYFATPRVPLGAESKVKERLQRAERDDAFRSKKRGGE